MVRARLHTICGNCGCNDNFTFEILEDDETLPDKKTPNVYLSCGNCVTLHVLSDNATMEQKQ